MHKNHEIVITQLRIESLLEGNNFIVIMLWIINTWTYSQRKSVHSTHIGGTPGVVGILYLTVNINTHQINSDHKLHNYL